MQFGANLHDSDHYGGAMESNDELVSQIRTSIAERKEPPEELLAEILEIGCKIFGEDIGILSKIDGDDYIVAYVHPVDGGIAPGSEYRLEETFCAITYEADRALGIADVRRSRWKTHPCTRTGLLSYIGVPIVIRGARFGTLNFSSPSPKSGDVSSDHLELITEMAGWASELVSLV